jgi:exo-1,4-beta-D-glucosaminidase
VEVVNYSVQNGRGLTAKLQVFDIDGAVKFTKEASLDCLEDSRNEVMPVTIPSELSGVYFVRLELRQGVVLISRNDYCRGANMDAAGGIGDLTAITKLPAVKLDAQTSVDKIGDHWMITTKLTNSAKVAAFNVRLKITGANSGKRILPAVYDDNYFTMLPGDARTIKMSVADADTQGEKPDVKVEGFNVK